MGVLELFIEVICHVLVRSHHRLALQDSRTKLDVFGIFGFAGERVQGLGVVRYHLAHVILIEVVAGHALELVEHLLVVIVQSRRGVTPQDSANGFMLADIFSCSPTIL
jgi:hypothetical protein